MPVQRWDIERPGLSRTIVASEFQDPLRFMRTEHSYQYEVLENLRMLIDEPRARVGQPRAGGVLDYLQLDFGQHLEDESALLDLLEQGAGLGPVDRSNVATARREVGAAGGLLLPVLDELCEIADGASPPAGGRTAAARRFPASALIFCEFMDLHTAFEEEAVLALAAKLVADDEIAALGRVMAERRGMAVPAAPSSGPSPSAGRRDVRPGDRFREAGPAGRVFSVARVLEPRHGLAHARLRLLGGHDRARTHFLCPLAALREERGFVRVSDQGVTR